LKDENLLEVVDLRKYFPIVSGLFKRRITYVHAVDDVCFNIKKTSTMGLVGESGCGKTTVGRTLMRLLDPTSGQILYNGNDQQIDIATLGKKKLRNMRRKMQIVFQDPQSSLNPRRTVHDTLAEPLQILEGKKGEELEIRILKLLDDVGLGGLANRFPETLSGGEQQRAAIARALAHRPALLLADEPTGNLDEDTGGRIIELLTGLARQQGTTLLLVTHSTHVAQAANRVLRLSHGRVVAD